MQCLGIGISISISRRYTIHNTRILIECLDSRLIDLDLKD